MELELLKIQQGFCGGAVMYHELIHKTPEEIAVLEAARKQKDALKAQRRRQQESNVQKKAAAREVQRRQDRVRVGLPPDRDDAGSANTDADDAAGPARKRVRIAPSGDAGTAADADDADNEDDGDDEHDEGDDEGEGGEDEDEGEGGEDEDEDEMEDEEDE